MEVVVTTEFIRDVQTSSHHQQTKIQIFYRPDALPVAQPTLSKHWMEKYYIPWTCSPQAHQGSSNLVSYTKVSQLPWEGSL